VEVIVSTISPKVPLISNRLQPRWRLARRQTLIAMPLPMACSDSGEWRDYTHLQLQSQKNLRLTSNDTPSGMHEKITTGALQQY
jgi:hypothetical protein